MITVIAVTTTVTMTAAVAATTTMTVANYNKEEEEEVEEKIFYSYVNPVHNQSYFYHTLCRKINLEQFSCHILGQY
jgi:hypothetical protein